MASDLRLDVRKLSGLLRRTVPLVWPVSVRAVDLPWPYTGLCWVHYREKRGPRGGRGPLRPTHHILLDRKTATSETLIHEWAHAKRVEDPGYEYTEAPPGSEQEDLDMHDDAYWLVYGQVYRAVLSTRYQAKKRASK